ncbi:MAG: acyltransferase [Planctomycetaceae bacterium]|nr:acyltransferase [Planctomycetaceae bacterium]
MKETLKIGANLAARICVAPAILLYRLETAFVAGERIFPGWSQALALLPGVTGVYLRRAFFRGILPQCGRDAWISFGTIFSHSTVCVGSGVYIGSYCVIGDADIQDDAMIASHVSVINGGRQHGPGQSSVALRERLGTFPRVSIGRNAWIGERAVVMTDVGDNGVVGAGAVVTKPVPPFTVVVGVPARVLQRGCASTVESPESAAFEAARGAMPHGWNGGRDDHAPESHSGLPPQTA